MLNSLFMINYYSFIQSFWTAKYNASTTNIEISFTTAALTALAKQVSSDETPANQALLDAEGAAQQQYITASQGSRAGIVTADGLAVALNAYQQAKVARRAVLPQQQTITANITQQAQSVFDLFQQQYNAEPENPEYKSSLIFAQSLRDTARDFTTQLGVYVQATESELDAIDESGKPPETYQDIINASNYTFDGTYSDAINHIAPTGQLYGQISIIPEIKHLYWWAGAKWYKIPDEVDQAANVSLLPIGRPFGDIFRVPRYVAETNSYVWDYYLSTGDEWILMNEYWEIDGVNNLPTLGYRIGDYHKVMERAIPVYWDGFQNRRQRISAFIDDVGITTSLVGLNSKTDTLQGDHNELLESFTGFQSATSESLADIAGEISDMATTTAKYASDGYITLGEANALKLSLNRLVSSSTGMLAVAGNLGLTTQADAYLAALSALTTEIDKWIDQTTYPKAITSNGRTGIKTLFENAEASEIALVNAISAKQAANAETNANGYTNEQLESVNSTLSTATGDISTLTIDLGQLSSSNYITLAAYSSFNADLSKATAQTVNGGTTLYIIATGLGITTEKTNFTTAVASLSSALSPFASATFPAAITTDQASAISTALTGVASTENILISKIASVEAENALSSAQSAIDDVDSALESAQSAISGLNTDVENLSSSTQLTRPEANLLSSDYNKALAQTVNSGTTLYTVAHGLNITTELTGYTSAVVSLGSGLASWINQSSYPKAITSDQRGSIAALVNAVSAAESVLVMKIAAVEAANAQAGAESTASYDLGQFVQVYDGFVRGLTPELALAYISEDELSLQPNYTDFDYLKVSDQNIQASKRTSVFTFTPILNWNESGQNLYQSLPQPGTTYWVYLANRSDGFQTSTYDYRGRLFLSTTTPVNNYLGASGLGLNAILIGQAETNSSTKFVNALDVSLISRQSNTKETFREFSDFDLMYVDENTLRLQKTYGTYGQMYIPESLYYLGDDREVFTTSSRIEMNNDGTLRLDTSAITNNKLYYVYIASDSDIYNFNSINSATNRPWHPEDSGSSGHYDATKDFRLYLFLSTQTPDNSRLAQSYYGFWARQIGQVTTDGVGKFVYSAGISAIRQATLQPSYLDGLAEISILDVSTTTFKIIRKRGTSGIVMVGSRGILTYDSDNPSVHAVTTSDTVYSYNESNPSSPASSTGTILDIYIGRPAYLYLANDRPCWGGLANRTFLSDLAPTSASYLSQNFPGNNARWIATINCAPGPTGSNLITNGNFNAGTSSWTATNWTYSSPNQNVAHNTGNTSALSQSISVSANATYAVTVTVSGVSAGSLTPNIGGTAGTPITTAGIFTQYIKATNTNGLLFIPTTNFNGAIDTITCVQVMHASFNGTYITDSIAKNIPTIDDTIISPSATWSSQKFMQVINDALGVSGTTSVFNAQKTGGLNLRLEYVNTTTVRLIPATGQDNYIVFPDLSFRTIPAAGIEATLSQLLNGATCYTNTRYYVYLTSSSFYMVTTPPDGLYTKLETLGTATIQVGDICMTSTNTMAGTWNVCSSHQEPTREWSTAINASSVTLALPGTILSLRAQDSTTRSGVTASGVWVSMPGAGTDHKSLSVISGSQTQRASSWYGATGSTQDGTLTITLTPSSSSPGILTASIAYSESLTITEISESTYFHAYGGSHGLDAISRSGDLVFTRSAT